MQLSLQFLQELQKRLKVGNRLSTHLNAIPGKSNYKLDFASLSAIDQNMPSEFLDTLLSKPKFAFPISWKDKEIDLFNISIGEQKKFISISKIFTNLLNQVNVIQQERGVETFGFGFPLIIRQDRKDKKLTVAPLIVWKLNLSRSPKNDAWIISKDIDSPIYLNEVLINHLQSDSEIYLDPLSSEILEDGIVTKEELFNICKDVLLKTNISKISNLDENLHELFSEIKAIQSEVEYGELALNDTNSMLAYSGLFSYFEIQKHSIIKDYDDLLNLAEVQISRDPIENGLFQSITSVPTDPSQQGFLNSLATIRNLVIQGPPGTGKSQTLTALLMNAMENGKKTIVVCEKHTALEVLYKSLDSVGLSSHIAMIVDASANRQKIISAARDREAKLNVLSTRYANGPYKFSAQLRNVNLVIEKINNQHKALDNELLAKYKWSDIIGKYLANHRLNEGEKIMFPADMKFIFVYDEYDEWRSILQQGQDLHEQYKSSGENSILNSNKFLASSFIQFDDQFNLAFSDYNRELSNLKVLKNYIFDQFVLDRNRELFKNKEIIEKAIKSVKSTKLNLANLLQHYKQLYLSRDREKLDQDTSRFNGIVTKLFEIRNRNQNNNSFINEEIHTSLRFKVGSWFSTEKKQVLRDVRNFNEYYNSLFKALSNSPHFEKLHPAKHINDNIDNFLLFNRNYNQVISEFSRKSENHFNSLDLAYLTTLSHSSQISEHIDLLKQRHFLSDNQKRTLDDLQTDINNFFSEQNLNWLALNEALQSSSDFSFDFTYDSSLVDTDVQITKIENRIANVVKSIQSTIDFEFLNADILKNKDLFSHLESYGQLSYNLEALSEKIKSDNYFKNFSPPVNLNAYIDYLEQLLTKKVESYDQNPAALLNTYNWYNFFNGLNDNQKTVVLLVKTTSNWEYSFLIFYFDRLLMKNATNDIPADDSLLREYVRKIEDIKGNQISTINDYWYKKQKESVARFNKNSADYQFKNLYNKKGSPGNRRYSLRHIVEKDCDLFTDLHPIILTTPEVSSTLFRNRHEYFDFVVFDEASQLRLEDNLPAMLKGKQVIIAGDEHQMPPSSFFEKKLIAGLLDNEEDDEQESYKSKDKSSVEASLLSSISLLDAVSELNFENRDLNFHYRSRHPYLIDFSNYAFYAQKLLPLPVATEYVPIKYINVNGIYDSNTNEKEADVVLSILKNNINKDGLGKYPSVGIATFNIKQRDLIKNKILTIKKLDRDPIFIKKLEQLESDGMFIKNLENIQGDERDVIIMSTTYGCDSSGKFAQRFGQLNNSKGYKLLNVIVTRAKFKNYIVTSIPEDFIGNYKSYLVTAGTNHNKAPIYAYLAYSKAVSDKNEDARKLVLQALAMNNPPSENGISSIEDKLESVFEEEVYYRLKDTDLCNFIELQYKVGGFRIDMVIDFKLPGVPKIAIECDGAKFHSSNEAYLYDFHRQKILESHGFKFHRIWGTNWWRNSDFEMQKLLAFAASVRTPKSGDLFDSTDLPHHIFTDEIQVNDEEKQSFKISEDNNEPISDNLLNEEEVIIAEEPFQKIAIDSVVKIKYLNRDEILHFKIVSPASSSRELSPPIREVLFNRPLGKALLGKKIGDVSSIEGVDNLVEILSIN